MVELRSALIFILCLSHTSSSRHPSIIIIGAGSAGIAAATRLLEHDFIDIKVIEAESRIGGRINSVKFGDGIVDLGAEWCHGQEGNIVYKHVKHLNILQHSSFQTKIFHSSGKLIENGFAHELAEIMDSIYAADGNRQEPDDRTLGDYCIENYNKTIYEKYGNDVNKLKVAILAMDYFQYSVLSYEGSFSWFESAAKNDYRDCDGDLNLNWNGLGYKTILDVLMKKYPDPSKQLLMDDKILLNKEVINIRWNRTSRNRAVTVSCLDGSMYDGDHVIFTPSVGVLKERGLYLFNPALPSNKIEAISNIGLGATMKVFMYFSEKWWKNSTDFRFIWSEEDKKDALWEFPEGPNWNGRSWVSDLYWITDTENNPKVLEGWFTGNLVPAIELLPTKVLMKGIEYVLKKFLGQNYMIIGPSKIIRSQWYSNHHFRGVYSFQTPKSRNGKVSSEIELGLPLKNFENRPIVQFAGEATHSRYFSTVHGAIESGYREADVLINLYFG